MRHLLLYIFLFLSNSAICQSDSALILNKIKETKKKNYKLKEKINKKRLDAYFEINFFKTDTVYNSKDSIKIRYSNKQNKLLREISITYATDNSSKYPIKDDSTIVFFNENNLVEYIESWSFISAIVYDSPEQGMVRLIKATKPSRTSHIRITYDSKNRENVIIMSLSTRITKMVRIYNKIGNLINTTSTEIDETEFWDD